MVLAVLSPDNSTNLFPLSSFHFPPKEIISFIDSDRTYTL